jgi:hypothetical protein
LDPAASAEREREAVARIQGNLKKIAENADTWARGDVAYLGTTA